MTLMLNRNEPYGDKRIITLEISDREIMQTNLIAFDHLLLNECNASNKISDQLLALETLARRIEESAGSSSETVQGRK